MMNTLEIHEVAPHHVVVEVRDGLAPRHLGLKLHVTYVHGTVVAWWRFEDGRTLKAVDVGIA